MMRRLMITALLIACSAAASAAAEANTDLILHDVQQVNLSRPISVVVTDTLPDSCTNNTESYACASAAYAQGRCTIWIKPARLEYLYHELQHCAGLTHTARGD